MTPMPWIWTLVALSGLLIPLAQTQAQNVPVASREEQLRSLRRQCILVPTWGWPAGEFGPAASRAGFTVVNAPWGNDIAEKADEVRAWSKAGLKMLVRPTVPVSDPFDPDDVRRGCAELKRFIRHYDGNPDVIGFTLAWGQTDEGGFPYGYEFSDKAREAFNARMSSPGQPLPQRPKDGHPGSLRWVQWLEFRSKVLVEFRTTFVAAAKEATNKLVGTWSEFYPVAHYELNMGDAPGADFLMYDLSFGDATVSQAMAFGECHGNMEKFEDFASWRKHELPLMAKGAGEGVIPVAFQFPMRRGHQHPSSDGVLIDNVEDEYALRIAPDIRELTAAVGGRVPAPEVAVVYQSFAAAGLPGGDEFFWPYQRANHQIEGALHQMGVHMKAIPYEHLATTSLDSFKLVIIPNPLYLNDAMRRQLTHAKRILFAGEFLLTHHDPASVAGDYAGGWSARGVWEHGVLRFVRADTCKLRVDSSHQLTRHLEVLDGLPYPSDQMVVFDPLPPDGEVLVWAGKLPAVLTRERGRIVHVTNRMFLHAYQAPDEKLERGLFRFLKNLLADCGVELRVKSGPHVRVNQGHMPYGSYGVSGHIAWNTTDDTLSLELTTGKRVVVPPHGWALVRAK